MCVRKREGFGPLRLEGLSTPVVSEPLAASELASGVGVVVTSSAEVWSCFLRGREGRRICACVSV